MQPTPWWEQAVISGQLPLRDELTFYVSHGDITGRVCNFIFWLLLLALVVRFITSFTAKYLCLMAQWLQRGCFSTMFSIGEEHQIFSIGFDDEGVACAAIEGALPPGGEVVDGVGEAGGL